MARFGTTAGSTISKFPLAYDLFRSPIHPIHNSAPPGSLVQLHQYPRCIRCLNSRLQSMRPRFSKKKKKKKKKPCSGQDKHPEMEIQNVVRQAGYSNDQKLLDPDAGRNSKGNAYVPFPLSKCRPHSLRQLRVLHDRNNPAFSPAFPHVSRASQTRPGLQGMGSHARYHSSTDLLQGHQDCQSWRLRSRLRRCRPGIQQPHEGGQR